MPSASSSTSKAPPLSELTARQIQWIGAGYAMTFSSMAGQTIFIAQFNAALRSEFSLSHGEFGFLYTAATLASSICLVFLGVLADKTGPRLLAVCCLCVLALLTIAMANVTSVIMLGVVLFGLRLFGQGMMTHIAVTTMSRWFNRFRGRALSFTQMGFPTGEAILPVTMTLAIAAIGWRSVWLVAAAVLVLVLAPLIGFLLRDPPDGKRALARGAVNPDADTSGANTGGQWTRGAVLRDKLFWLILPGFMGPPAIGTLFIFHQAHLAEIKAWDLTLFTAFFPALSVATVVMALTSGVLIDRFGAYRLVPLVLVPEGIACIVIALLDPIWAAPVFFAFIGMTMGLMSPVVGALWAELYGTAHIGAIRALATSAFVLASAIGPGIAGGLIDIGFELDVQGWIYAVYCFGMSAAYLALRPLLADRIRSLSAERQTSATT